MKRHDDAAVAAVIAESEAISAEREAARLNRSDGFAIELDATVDDELLAEVASLLTPVTPGERLRGRILRTVDRGRLARHRRQVAHLLDVDEAVAAELLDGIDQPASFVASPIPGVTLFHVEGGRAVDGAITGFIHVERGGVFPQHEHLGHEYVLVVQGAFRDTTSGVVYRPGDLSVMAPGSGHQLEVEPGPSLIYLAVVFDGVGVGGETFRPGDPRL